MKWSVLGVLVVFLAQAGFIAYTSLERQSDEFVARNGVPAGSDPDADALSFLTEFDSPIAGPEQYPETADARVIAASTLERRNSKRPTEPNYPASRKVPQYVPPASTTFEPVIIAVRTDTRQPKFAQPEASLTSFDTKEQQAFSKTVSRPEKRSFVAKSVSVLKKPYDWLKLLGSKL